MNLKLNIYDNTGKKVVKTVKGEMFDLSFGTVRKLMKLLKIEDTKNTAQVLQALTGTWDEVTTILNNVYPGVTEDEWDNVKVKELLPQVMEIAKFAIGEALTIPSDSKN